MTIKPELGRYPWTPAEEVTREGVHVWSRYDIPLCGYFEYEGAPVVFRQVTRFGDGDQHGVSVLITLDDGDLEGLQEMLKAGREDTFSREEFYDELGELAETRPTVYVATTNDTIIAVY